MKVAIKVPTKESGHLVRGVGFYTKRLIEGLKSRSDVQLLEFNGDIPEGVDVVHFPFFDLYSASLKVNRRVSVVVTIHDVIPLVFPSHYPVGLRGRLAHMMQRKSLGKVTRIITDSKASKEDLLKYLKLDRDKVDVVYLAASSDFKVVKDEKKLSEVRNKFSLPEKYAIYVGDVNWNKNILGMTRACLDSGLDIVLVGKAFEKTKLEGNKELESYRNFLEEFGDDARVHILGFLKTEDLVCVMNLASVCMLVSFAEGFGLSILEAQSCGVPVVASDRSSLPEVAGEGAVLVDPYKVENIAAAVRNIVDDEALRKKLIAKGFINRAKFSWERCIKETIMSYHKAMED